MAKTYAEIKPYLDGQERGKLYELSKDNYEKLRTHADGETPVTIIEERRPCETEEIHEYRKKIYRSKTRNPVSRVINSLGKIRRSPDWSIRHKAEDLPNRVSDSEAPAVYFEEEFPDHQSLTAWYFDIGLREYLLDAMAVIAVIPIELEAEDNDYYRPYPYVFNSDKVYEYKPDKLAILLSSDHSSLKEVQGKGAAAKYGKVFYVIDTEDVQRFEETDTGTYEETEIFNHKLGYLPAFRVKGEHVKAADRESLYVSRIFGMVDHLDEAAREYSDLQAEVVQHIHSQKWYINDTPCGTCQGRTKTFIPGSEEWITCPDCKGSGIASTSPYAEMHIKPAKLGENQGPIPPAGYIEKDTEIVKVQAERVSSHIYDALSSINFEFLYQVPLNQSGKAKEVDRDELNNFVYLVAEDSVRILSRVYLISNDIRYGELLAAGVTGRDLVPDITVPERYDLLSSTHLIDQYKAAKDAGISPSILGQMESEIAAKKFRSSPEIAQVLTLVYNLDPLAGLSDEQKVLRLNNGGISPIDYVISSNIENFIRDAIEDNGNFSQEDRVKQVEALRKLAQELTTQIDTGAALKAEFLPGDPNPPAGSDPVLSQDKDLDAEAKAKLRGTVGGIQGVLNIIQAVGTGVMAQDAGKAMIIEFYGLDDALATRLLAKAEGADDDALEAAAS